MVLSDKKEALDVVEDKVTEVMNAIRPGDDFQNPILRLGNYGNTYTKILSPAAMGGIEEHYKASRRNEEERKEEIRSLEKELHAKLNALCEGYEHIHLATLEELFSLEKELKHKDLLCVEVDEVNTQMDGIETLKSLKSQLDGFNATLGKRGTLVHLQQVMQGLDVPYFTRDALDVFLTYVEIARNLGAEIATDDKKGKSLKGLSLFKQFSTSQLSVLEEHVRAGDTIKSMLFANVRGREEIKKLTDSFLQHFSTTMRKSIMDNFEAVNAAFEVFQKAMTKKASRVVEGDAALDYLRDRKSVV